MVDDRAPLGLLVAALGAAVLAVAVFLPWYGVSITASGAASAQQELATVAQQYGNSTFQTGEGELGAEFSSLAGRQLTTVSAHQALRDISRILLVLAGISLLASLLRLAGITGLLEAGGGQIALAGCLAVLFVLYRMLPPPGARRGSKPRSRFPRSRLRGRLLGAMACVTPSYALAVSSDSDASCKSGAGMPPLATSCAPVAATASANGRAQRFS